MAEKCVEGITLSENNYRKAFDLLEERYGNKQLIIASHVNQLLRLEKIRTVKIVQELRNLFDQIESHVRSLCTLNVMSEHYGPLLIPLILERLPDEIKLQISRRLGTDNWQIEEFMNTLKLEITARESCNFMKAQSSTEFAARENCSVMKTRSSTEKSHQHITTDALMTGTRLLICAFCSKNHYHDKCSVVTDFEERKEIVRRNRLCFKCLVKGHNIRNCRNKRNCFNCKASNHHTAICGKYDRKRKFEENVESINQVSNFIGSQTTVLLQTASGVASDNRGKRSVPVKVVLDSGAERTYITEKLVRLLKLNPNSSKNVVLNTFGDPEGKSVTLKDYSFCVKNPKRDCNLYLTGFAVPVICVPLTVYDVNVIEASFPLFKDLCFSDTELNTREIDLLIGMDYYWSVVEDENIRCDTEGLVAVNSKLGWLLSGPLRSSKENESSTVKLATHTMFISFNENEREVKELNNQVEKFWDLDTLGIRDNEISVYDKFMNDVKFVNGRYEVRLPFKEDHPLIEDNYALAVRRLEALKNKLNKNPKLLKQYDEIMQNQLK